MKKFLLLGLLGIIATTLVGCETISGFGKDLEKAGTVISDAAN